MIISNTPNKKRPQIYRGRFAPSPSGELHFGSLVTALASYLDAKSNQGIWLVRVEDIDPPREKVGASQSILSTLETFGLHWDETVLFQSTQSDYYRNILADLASKEMSYYCQCSRADIKAIGGIYAGHCLSEKVAESSTKTLATRLKNTAPMQGFNDLIQGHINFDQALACEDFIIKRKDGLFAYQLAVVADDIFQNITHVIRGCDLIEPTARQLSFFQVLQAKAPLFGHVPLAVTEQGYKLSKQNNALALDTSNPKPSIIAALHFLGMPTFPELLQSSVEGIIEWAVKHWSLQRVPKQQEITIEKQSAY